MFSPVSCLALFTAVASELVQAVATILELVIPHPATFDTHVSDLLALFSM